MLRNIALCGLVLAASSVAFAEVTTGDIDIFFSTSAVIESKAVEAPVIPVDVSGGPVAQRLYVWGNIDLYDYRTWNGLGLDFETAGGVTVTGGGVYNPDMGTAAPLFRWSNPETEIPMTAGGYLNATAVGTAGLGMLPANGDFAADPGDTLAYSNLSGADWLGSYLIGYIDVEVSSVESAVNFAISPAWTTRMGDDGFGPYGMVAFGLNDPVLGRETGAGGFAGGRLNDVTFVPEPAALTLLALGLVLARRR